MGVGARPPLPGQPPRPPAQEVITTHLPDVAADARSVRARRRRRDEARLWVATHRTTSSMHGAGAAMLSMADTCRATAEVVEDLAITLELETL